MSDSKLPVLASSFPLTYSANHPGYIAQIKKMADKAKWKFIWNNELEGKRLQKNLWLGEASCGMQNRGEILLDSLCSIRLSNVYS